MKVFILTPIKSYGNTPLLSASTDFDLCLILGKRSKLFVIPTKDVPMSYRAVLFLLATAFVFPAKADLLLEKAEKELSSSSPVFSDTLIHKQPAATVNAEIPEFNTLTTNRSLVLGFEISSSPPVGSSQMSGLTNYDYSQLGFSPQILASIQSFWATKYSNAFAPRFFGLGGRFGFSQYPSPVKTANGIAPRNTALRRFELAAGPSAEWRVFSRWPIYARSSAFLGYQAFVQTSDLYLAQYSTSEIDFL